MQSTFLLLCSQHQVLFAVTSLAPDKTRFLFSLATHSISKQAASVNICIPLSIKMILTGLYELSFVFFLYGC